MGDSPPPPPRHGTNPRSSSGLPPGKYDIFIIPPHSSGNGFLYLPSLKPNLNSFVAGYASALATCALGAVLYPTIQFWYHSLQSSGGTVMLLLVLAVGMGGWTLGRTQGDGPGPGGDSDRGNGTDKSSHDQEQQQSDRSAPPPQPGKHQYGAPPSPSPNHPPPPQSTNYDAPPTQPPQAEKPKESWTRPAPAPAQTPAPGPSTPSTPSTPKATATPKFETPSSTKPKPSPTKSTWEQAREETKRKLAEAKAAQDAKDKREENERRLKEMRERDAQERAAREKKQRDKELAEQKADGAAAEAARPKPATTYAYSATGEKTNPWPNGRPVTPPLRSPPAPTQKRPPSPKAETYRGTEEDSYSYRPYDKPRTSAHQKAPSSVYSESSYAASHSTSRTTPPPSHRGPYSTKDPDKIVIKAVYSFNNAFQKTPVSQLVSGVGLVTDGLILRITTEGLFIDDDVRGVPQREWDIKAWTMKLVEVWCPVSSVEIGSFPRASASASGRTPNPVRRLWNLEKDRATNKEEADAFCAGVLKNCKSTCRFAPSASSSSTPASFASSPLNPKSNSPSDKNNQQTGKNDHTGYHILRANIRDQEGKKYIFVVPEEEAWKVMVGIGKLRKGSQVRALGVASMSAGDAKSTLEYLGWV